MKMEFVLPELYKPVALVIAGDATGGIPPRKKLLYLPSGERTDSKA